MTQPSAAPAAPRQQSPSQTVGPFFHPGLIRGGENVMVSDETRGERIWIRGRMLDGEGQPVPDAMVEAWQADAGGRFNHPADPERALADPHFAGFGRCASDPGGAYSFRTVRPGAVARPGLAAQAPHVNLRVFARGLLIHAVTRLYFADEPSNAGDAVLNSVETPRQVTLLAAREDAPDGPTYRLDIVLQGERETVFFDV